MAYPEYYEILQVAIDADPEDIKKSYLRLVKQYHPDVNQGDSAAEETLKRINEAYDVLKDLAKRAEYDYMGTIEANAAPQNIDTTLKPDNIASPHKPTEKHFAVFSWGKKFLQFLWIFSFVAIGMVYFAKVYRIQPPKNNAAEKNNTYSFMQKSLQKISRYTDMEKLLVYAANNNHKLLLSFLLKSFSQPSPTLLRRFGLLLLSVQDVEIAKMLIDYGADVNTKDKSGETALTQAVRRSDAAMTELLLQAGADANYVLPDGTTALQLATRNNDTIIMTLLQGKRHKEH